MQLIQLLVNNIRDYTWTVSSVWIDKIHKEQTPILSYQVGLEWKSISLPNIAPFEGDDRFTQVNVTMLLITPNTSLVRKACT